MSTAWKIAGGTASVLLLAAGPIRALARGTEQASYTVLMTQGAFELRQYAPMVVAETVVETGDFDDASNEGFRRLAGFIFGKNRTRGNIPMTAPVTMESGPGGWVMQFVMPSEYSMETLPQPVDPRVTLRPLAGRRMAALRFSGRGSDAQMQEKEAALRQLLDRSSMRPSGRAIYARYNAPMVPPFLRRNEVLVPLM